MDEDFKQIPGPIQWGQGMLLTPEHFLELAGRYEMLQQSMAVLQPFSWGVARFEFDKAGVSAGKITIRALDAVMPDGALVSVSDGDVEPLIVDKAEQSRTIYIALPGPREFNWTGANARYQPCKAGSGTSAAIGIPRLRPILHLRAETPPPRFVSMPLMRLEFTTEFTNHFEPPWIVVPKTSELFDICSALVALIRNKIGFLVAQIKNPGQSLTGVPELRDRLRCLVSGLPVLETLLHTGPATPHSLYLALCTIAGHVALMGRDLAPPDFKPYDPCELLACFKEVAAFIETPREPCECARELAVHRTGFRFLPVKRVVVLVFARKFAETLLGRERLQYQP